MNDQSQMMNQSQMLNRSYGIWPPPPPPPPPEDSLKFQNPSRPAFVAAKPGRNNWKGKKIADKRKENRRKEKAVVGSGGAGVGGLGGGGGYKPPTLHELQSQNRLKARRMHRRMKSEEGIMYQRMKGKGQGMSAQRRASATVTDYIVPPSLISSFPREAIYLCSKLLMWPVSTVNAFVSCTANLLNGPWRKVAILSK
uniref:Uncharacterized protein n=1 Tax=Nelumbo nucifera TaxID=4432 RepID=A0A822YD19_NELNU|nr:TPA_asm: hypothetical protein HUJ06_031491 [Nelumbo nucifera]